jgi:hypothetical protein
MKWDTAAGKIGMWLSPDSREGGQEPLTTVVELPVAESAGPKATPKIRKLRRRLLSRKGARLLTSMVDTHDKGMLSVLDVNGMVVFWHDGSEAADKSSGVLDQHVAQFYAPKKIARSLAHAHLERAFAHGKSSEVGWRRRADGTVFWGITVIEPLLLADDRLQGFTHITHAVNEPSEPVVRVESERTGLVEDRTRAQTTDSFVRSISFLPKLRFPRAAPQHYAAPRFAFG